MTDAIEAFATWCANALSAHHHAEGSPTDVSACLAKIEALVPTLEPQHRCAARVLARALARQTNCLVPGVQPEDTVERAVNWMSRAMLWANRRCADIADYIHAGRDIERAAVTLEALPREQRELVRPMLRLVELAVVEELRFVAGKIGGRHAA